MKASDHDSTEKMSALGGIGEGEEDSEMPEINEDSQKIEENEQDYAKLSFIIPSCSAWFNLDSIHEIEMQALPEWFCAKFPHKNPETYLEYRNYIIKLYRENTNSYLSATSKHYSKYLS